MARKQKKHNELSYIAFLLGLLLVLTAAAMQVGVVPAFMPVNVSIVVLVLISLLVALSNIQDDEIDRFLLVSLTLAVISIAQLRIGNYDIPYVGAYVNAILDYLKFLVLPGTLVIALKVGYKLLKD